jgi:Tfp pilus assembly protein PilF
VEASRAAIASVVRGFGYDAEETASWAKKLEEIDPERAGKLYRQAIGQPPKSASVSVAYARFLVERCHDDELAANYFREAVDLAPTDVYVLTDFVTFMRQRPGGVAEAIARLERALIARSDERWLVLEYAALLAEADGNLDRAGPFLQEVLEAYPEDGMAHYVCSAVYADFSDRIDEADRCIRKASVLAPREWCIARFAGDFFLRKVLDANAAEANLRRATELKGDDHRSLFYLAELLRVVRKDMDGAEAAYRRLITLAAEPEYVEALATFLCAIRHRADETETTYRLAIDLSFQPQWLRPHFAFFLHRVRADKAGAREQLEVAVNESSRHPSLVLVLAAFLAFELSDYENAQVLFEEVVDRKQPDAIHLSLYAAFVADCLGDLERADELFRRAVQTQSANPCVLVNYGSFLVEHGRLAEGMQHLEAALNQTVGPPYQDWTLLALLLGLMFGPVERRPGMLAKVRAALVAGERCPSSHLNASLLRAQSSDDQSKDWWEPLIDVALMRSPIEVLATWPAWRNA